MGVDFFAGGFDFVQDAAHFLNLGKPQRGVANQQRNGLDPLVVPRLFQALDQVVERHGADGAEEEVVAHRGLDHGTVHRKHRDHGLGGLRLSGNGRHGQALESQQGGDTQQFGVH
jgi:hypothetical protein